MSSLWLGTFVSRFGLPFADAGERGGALGWEGKTSGAFCCVMAAFVWGEFGTDASKGDVVGDGDPADNDAAYPAEDGAGELHPLVVGRCGCDDCAPGIGSGKRCSKGILSRDGDRDLEADGCGLITTD
jgi:hypothetical protein